MGGERSAKAYPATPKGDTGVNVRAAPGLCTRVDPTRPTVQLVGPKAEHPEGSGLVSEWEQLYRDAGPQLWRAIYGFVGGRRQVAEDAVAEAFARAIEHADEIRSPLPWLYRTAFRLAVRELQREKRRPPHLPEPVPGIDPGEVQDVLKALGALSTSQRAAILLHDEEGFTGPEVGRLLGISAATVRVHLFRGRRRLRELLGSEEEIIDD